MAFKLEIETDNAAFETSPEMQIALILSEQVIPQVYRGDLAGKVRDVNGNTVGNWSLS